MAHSLGSTLKVSNLSDYVQVFLRAPLEKFFARGEPRDYGTTVFMPSIWRSGHAFTDLTPVASDSTFTKGELEALKKCQQEVLAGRIVDHYFERFISNRAAAIDFKDESLFQWAALAQHYNLRQQHPTRLVDVTRDPFVALYFAVESHPDESGFVYYFRHNFNEITQHKIIKRGGSYFDILEVSDPGVRFPCKPDHNTPNIARNPYPNMRIEAQRGAFCWTRGITQRSFGGGAIVIEIEPANKLSISQELRRINYDRDSLFPS